MDKKKTILIVDDDRDIRGTLAFILQGFGHIVHEAHHGQAALDLLPRIPRPDLILLDRMMPVMDGPEFFANLKLLREFEGIPVVLFSANLEGVDLTGFAGAIAKPAGLDEILSHVDRHCR